LDHDILLFLLFGEFQGKQISVHLYATLSLKNYLELVTSVSDL
jgi:hypothetical protein